MAPTVSTSAELCSAVAADLRSDAAPKQSTTHSTPTTKHPATEALAADLALHGVTSVSCIGTQASLTPQQACPGLATFLLVASHGTDEHRSKVAVLTDLTALVEPTSQLASGTGFIPSTPPGVTDTAAQAAFKAGFGGDPARASARACTYTLLHLGVIRAAATLANPHDATSGGVLSQLALAFLLSVVKNHLLDVGDAPSPAALIAHINARPLLAESIDGASGRIAQIHLGWFSWLSTVVTILARCGVVTVHPNADLLNLLVDVLLTRVPDLVPAERDDLETSIEASLCGIIHHAWKYRGSDGRRPPAIKLTSVRPDICEVMTARLATRHADSSAAVRYLHVATGLLVLADRPASQMPPTLPNVRRALLDAGILKGVASVLAAHSQGLARVHSLDLLEALLVPRAYRGAIETDEDKEVKKAAARQAVSEDFLAHAIISLMDQDLDVVRPATNVLIALTPFLRYPEVRARVRTVDMNALRTFAARTAGNSGNAKAARAFVKQADAQGWERERAAADWKDICGNPDCRVLALGKDRFGACARCETVVYCRGSCQKAHWKKGGHKAQCKPAAAATVR